MRAVAPGPSGGPPREESMVFAALDLCFNVVCERALLGGGARLLWLARGRSIPFEEQMQATLPDLCAGVAAWSLLLLATCAVLR
jgi:hypothetical protein